MTRTDRASLLVHVDRAVAFAALTEADALATWLPPADMRGRFESFEMRTGGAYRLVLTYDDASGSPGKTTADEDVSNVRIREIVPGERVVQEIEFEATDPNLQGMMTMEWNLHDDPAGTIVEIVARDVPLGVAARDHAAGLTSSLANLAAFLEPEH